METVFMPEALAPGNNNPIKLLKYQTSHFVLRRQVQLTSMAFCFIHSGSKEVITQGGTRHFEASDAVILKKGSCFVSEFPSKGHQSFSSTVLFVSTETLQDFFQKMGHVLQKKADSITFQPFNDIQFLPAFQQSLLCIDNIQGPLRTRLLQAKLEELVCYILETKGKHYLDFLVAGEGKKARKFKEIVTSNRLKNLSIKEIAFLANMSPSSFNREFQKQFGESPAKWFLNQRLEHSKFLLQQKNRRPSEIFEEVGYQSLSNFTQAFKAKYGLTPGNFQKN